MSELTQEISFVQGAKVVIDLYLENKTELPRPIDLTDFDEFEICFPTSGNPLVITHDLGANDSEIVKVAPDELGHLRLTISSVDSATVSAGDSQSFQVSRNNSLTPNKQIILMKNSLNVEEKLC